MTLRKHDRITKAAAGWAIQDVSERYATTGINPRWPRVWSGSPTGIHPCNCLNFSAEHPGFKRLDCGRDLLLRGAPEQQHGPEVAAA